MKTYIASCADTGPKLPVLSDLKLSLQYTFFPFCQASTRDTTLKQTEYLLKQPTFLTLKYSCTNQVPHPVKVTHIKVVSVIKISHI
jgi:hypothetical protein